MVMRRSSSSPARLGLFGLLCLVGATGCRSTPKPPASQPALAPNQVRLEKLDLVVTPPAGWQRDADKVGDRSTTVVYVSPTGQTAFGVIAFKLPFPVGHDWALWGFLQNMKKSEGRADLVEKKWDESMSALRFIAEGGRFKVRTNLFVRGTQGWAAFAGTKAGEAENPAELKEAETARDEVRPPAAE
jgi:hypothetical protein